MPQYLIRDDVVAACLQDLRNKKIHNNFAGYLSIVRTAARDKRTNGIQVNFKEFFETFFRVPDAPLDKPYAQPFWEAPASDANMFFNTNVAGSYAPSSLRSESPFLRVVNISGKGRDARYSLKKDHAVLALEIFSTAKRFLSFR